MSSILNVFRSSIRHLVNHPGIFLPKIFSTLLGSLWFVGFLSGTGPQIIYLLTAPLLVFLAVFVSVYLAAMVKESSSGQPLLRGFEESVDQLGSITAVTLIFLALTLVIEIPLAAGIYIYLMNGGFLFLVAGASVTALLFFLLAFLIYFLPISLLEKDSVIEGFRGSVSTSRENRREVFALTLFSFMILGLASLTTNSSLEYLGYAGFVFFRLASGVVSTYIFVVSPEFYLQN